MFADLDRDLHFGYQRNGSLVLAFNKEEEEELRLLMMRGKKNGIELRYDHLMLPLHNLSSLIHQGLCMTVILRISSPAS
jgi:L-2-hydroxyglutarate oxidase LhgO